MNKEKAILVDLDGTLADITERRKILGENKDFNLFYSEIPKDKLNFWCSEIINKFKQDYKIILITGREEIPEVKKNTLNWLNKHNIYFDNIYFRPLKDNRKDSLIKEEIYENNIKDKYEVLFVVDDRKQVTEMWRSKGITCLQCDWGDF
jgi:uncharacterized HAD superfamily protein